MNLYQIITIIGLCIAAVSYIVCDIIGIYKSVERDHGNIVEYKHYEDYVILEDGTICYHKPSIEYHA